MLVVFALLVIAALILQKQPEEIDITQDPFPTQTPTYYLVSTTVEDVTHVKIEDADGQVTIFSAGEDGEWMFVEPATAAEEADNGAILSAVAQISNLRIESMLEAAPPLDAMGLDTPAFTITITLRDGEEIIILVGDQTPIENGYYAQVQGDAPRVVSLGVMDVILDLLREPPLMPTPDPNATAEEDSGEFVEETPEAVLGTDAAPTPQPTGTAEITPEATVEASATP